MAVVAVERGDERVRVLPVANRQAGQDQPGRPALGPFHEALHVAGASRRPMEAFRSADASSCVNRSSATRSSTSSSGPHPGQGERRVGSRGQRHMDAGREVVQEEAECLVAGRVGDEVVVVQDQEQRRGDGMQVVEQRRHDHPVEVGAGAPQRLERGRPHLRLDRPQGLRHIDPQAGRIVVLLVDREPGDPAATGRPPLAEQGGLAEPGGRVQEAQPGLHALLEQRQQAGARDQPGPQGRWPQLAPHQLEPWPARRLGRARVRLRHLLRWQLQGAPGDLAAGRVLAHPPGAGHLVHDQETETVVGLALGRQEPQQVGVAHGHMQPGPRSSTRSCRRARVTARATSSLASRAAGSPAPPAPAATHLADELPASSGRGGHWLQRQVLSQPGQPAADLGQRLVQAGASPPATPSPAGAGPRPPVAGCRTASGPCQASQGRGAGWR